MKRGCLLAILLYLALAGGYYALLQGRYDPPAPWVGALAAAFVSWLALGLLGTARQARRDVTVLRAAASGAGPEDGKPWVASGTLEPVGTPLRAPFTGRPAALYSYEIFREVPVKDRGRTRMRKTVERTGFALTPSVVRGRRDPVRLLGFPVPDEFASERVSSPAALAGARHYLAATEFVPLEGLAPGRMYREIKDVLGDDDGAVRKDWRLTREEPDLERSILAETIVPPGTEVTVLGVYSAAGGGLVPDLRGTGSVNRMFPGSDAALRQRLGGSSRGHALAGLILLALTQLALWGLLERRQSFYAPQRQQAFVTAARSGDRAGIERLLRLGAKPDELAGGDTALVVAPDGPTTRLLLERGAGVDAADGQGETALIAAARRGDLEQLGLLLAAGADPDRRAGAHGDTALVAALDSGQEGAADLLRKAGAVDETVTAANGVAVVATPAGAEAGTGPFDACRAWLAAVQGADAASLERLATPRRPGFFAEIDFDAWRGTRILDPTLVEGHQNAEAATLTLRGPTGGGFEATWVYQLRWQGGRWKIARERWVRQE